MINRFVKLNYVLGKQCEGIEIKRRNRKKI